MITLFIWRKSKIPTLGVDKMENIQMRSASVLKIKGIDILAVLTISIVLLDVPYLNFIYNLRSVKIAVFGLAILCELFYFTRHRLVLKIEHVILLIDAMFILIVTLLYKGSLVQCVSDLGAAISISVLVIICKKKSNLQRVLRIWCFFLLVLLAVDTATIVIWPNGLYVNTFVHNNWFLGYKTNRLIYTFSLLVFYMYSELLDCEVLSRSSFILAIFVSINAFMSKGSGSVIAVIAYSIFMYILFGKKRKKLNRPLTDSVKWLFDNHVLLVIIGAIAFLVIVVFQNQILINKIIVGVFNKAYSFNERTIAWVNVIQVIKKHWLIGVGIQSREQIMLLTGGFTNAHNTLFTYLMTGGIIGLFMLTIVIASSLRKTPFRPSNYAVTVYFYCTLFLGLNSSTLAFCPFFFAILILPFNDLLQT